jgi:ANTAR domain
MTGQPHHLYAQADANRKQSRLLAKELQATRLKTSENWQLIRVAWERTEQLRAQRLAGRTDPDHWLRYSTYARLQARLASMPVIEQAKGIIMAKYGWPEEQAFDALRRASQRENIKVRELAVRVVAQTARGGGVRAAASTPGSNRRTRR